MGASSDLPGTTRLGEVIETSSVRIWVESDRLHDLPPLGSVVQVSTPGGEPIFAVVSFGQTGGIDASRRAIRRGSDEIRDDEIYRQHPELSRILRTTFEARPVAFRRDGVIVRSLPPLPPPLHYSVEPVRRADLRELTDQPRYFNLLVRAEGEVPPEELIVAHVRCVYEARDRDAMWLEVAAREISRLYKDDYDRLLPILEALDPEW